MKQLLAILLFSSSLAYSQEGKLYKTEGELINSFLNSPRVLNHFTLSTALEDSTITFIDVNEVLKGITFENWNGYHVIIQNSGLMVDTIKKFDAFHIRTRKRNLLILQKSEKPNQLSYFLFQPTSNGTCNAISFKKQNGIVIREIRRGWF